MKTPFKYLIFLLISVMTSCGETNLRATISEEYKPELSNNDTLLFLDSLNNKIDTFHLSLTHISADSDIYDYSERFTIRYVLTNNHANIYKFWISQGNRSVIVSLDKYDYDRPDIWNRIEYLPKGVNNTPFYIPSNTSPYENTLENNLKVLNQIKRTHNIRSLK
ncbi:MAG: hypothetical protein HGA35_02390 [Erysipelotrichaceae bacterium]|nr:hypothetical protein [Erysipelotrichaceae bacterium]